MVAIILIALTIFVLLLIGWYFFNGWSSRARDREETARLRTSRQMANPPRADRGSGIN